MPNKKKACGCSRKKISGVKRRGQKVEFDLVETGTTAAIGAAGFGLSNLLTAKVNEFWAKNSDSYEENGNITGLIKILAGAVTIYMSRKEKKYAKEAQAGGGGMALSGVLDLLKTNLDETTLATIGIGATPLRTNPAVVRRLAQARRRAINPPVTRVTRTSTPKAAMSY